MGHCALVTPGLSGSRKYRGCPCSSPQLSHDANETLPLHLYVKSYGKNVDSKLQGMWAAGLVGGGRRGSRAGWAGRLR